jgi:hypothetical protein
MQDVLVDLVAPEMVLDPGVVELAACGDTALGRVSLRDHRARGTAIGAWRSGLGLGWGRGWGW